MKIRNKKISLSLVFGMLCMMILLYPTFTKEPQVESVVSVTEVTESELRVAQLEVAPLSNDERKVLFDGLRQERACESTEGSAVPSLASIRKQHGVVRSLCIQWHLCGLGDYRRGVNLPTEG